MLAVIVCWDTSGGGTNNNNSDPTQKKNIELSGEGPGCCKASNLILNAVAYSYSALVSRPTVVSQSSELAKWLCTIARAQKARG